MIVQLEAKKKELQKRIAQLESEKDQSRDQFTKALKEKMDLIDNLNTQMREMELVEISRDLMEKAPNAPVDMEKIVEEVQQRFLTNQMQWNSERDQLQSEIDTLRDKNHILETQLEESNDKVDGLRDVQAAEREEETMLIQEMQDKIVQSEKEMNKYRSMYEGNTRQIELLKEQVRLLMGKEQEISVKYHMKMESTQVRY